MYQENDAASPSIMTRLLRLRCDIAAQQVIMAAQKLHRLTQKAGFDHNEPRNPCGTPGAGCWTRVAGTGDAGTGGATAKPKTPKHSVAAPTEADMKRFVTVHRPEAQKLALALGHGATADEFLALSSVETKWDTADATTIGNNYFGLHNLGSGPYPGQTGTYITSGIKNVAGYIVPRWVPPYPDGSAVQAVAAFPANTGYSASGSFVVKQLTKAGKDYSNPITFFATIRALGWAQGTTPTEYVRILLQRHRRVSRY